jgi:hypothetical protein
MQVAPPNVTFGFSKTYIKSLGHGSINAFCGLELQNADQTARADYTEVIV